MFTVPRHTNLAFGPRMYENKDFRFKSNRY